MTDRRRDFESRLEAVYLPLLRSATVLCWSSADVEDVVQETLLQALRSQHSFNEKSALLTWAYVILTRVAAAANQKRRRRTPSNDLATVADELPPVDSGMIADEQHRAVTDAIRNLPQRQREIVTLHFLADLSYAQIAEALGLSVGTVKATMFAAKASLRAALSPSESSSR